MKLCVESQNIILDKTGAVFWIEKKALFIADAHLGKVNHFRKNGIAVPHHSQFSFYTKINQLVDDYAPEIIYFLGDLFHSEKNKAWDDFELWVKKQSCQLLLISGNHDIIHKNHFINIGIQVVESLDIAPFLLTHFPTESSIFNFCGHVHPGVRLQGKGRQRLKVPCFFQRPKQMILPAFGVFTGIHLIHPTIKDKVYVLSNQNVIPIALK